MDLIEDLNALFEHFGVVCTAGAVTGRGNLDMPSQVLAGDMVLTTDYLLTAKASDFGGLLYGDAITVDGLAYQVRETRRLDDGLLVEISLAKLAPDTVATGSTPRAFGLADLADVNITSAGQGDMLINDGTEWVDTNVIDGGGAG